MNLLFVKKGAAIYFMLCMFVSLFFTYSGSDQNEFIDFPHVVIRILPLYLDIFITFVFFVFLLFDKKSKVDIIAFLLFCRFLLHCIPVYYAGMTSHFMMNFIVSVLCICVYLIHLNYNDSGNFLIDVFKVFFLILCFQIGVESFISANSFFDDVYFYKVDMALPIGSSNSLAAKLVPVFAILFMVERKNALKFLLLALAMFAVALTKSRSGVFGLLFVLIIALSWRGTFSVKEFLKIIFIALVVISVSSFFLMNSDIGMLVFSDSDSTLIERNRLLQNGLDLFWDHPFFGNGFYYFDMADNPHNWILDILMRSGLAGLALMLIIFAKIWFEVKDFLRDDIVRGCLVALLCMLWQGLAEIVLFGYIQDILMWSIVGLMIARVGYLKRRVNNL